MKFILYNIAKQTIPHITKNIKEYVNQDLIKDVALTF